MENVTVHGFTFKQDKDTGDYILDQELPSDDGYDCHTFNLSKYDIIILSGILQDILEGK